LTLGFRPAALRLHSILVRISKSMKPTHFHRSNSGLPQFRTIFSLGAPIITALALASPVAAQSDADSVVSPDALPPGLQKSVQVMVEFTDVPAAVLHAQALKEAQAQADAARNYALAHPNAPGSQAVLKSTKKVEISQTAAGQVESHAQHLDQVQQGMLPSLTSGKINGRVLFRVQHAYNGIALVVSPNAVSEIAQLPGVKAVHPMNPKYPNAAFSDIDFLRARGTAPGGPWTAGVHGESIKVADIDTGLDYVHANFDGNGDYSGVTDTNPNGHFPNAKVPGGTDLVGDSYNADPTSPAFQPVPHPDNNPFDCNGHGTATASLITGFGVNNNGTTYTGTYDATNPAISALKISPGFAPKALLYPVRVFGCAGSTNVVTQAIDWAITNHMDVINMSLGANEGFADDPDDVAATNAASVGILVCSAAGNAGDSYYIHSSPAAATGTLGVAATFNNQGGFIFDSNVTSNTTGGGGVGTKYFSIKGSASAPIPAGGITGNVVYAVPNNANAPLTNAAQVSGNICLIDRGVTTFTDKVTKAFNAGATAVIVDNATCNPNCSVPIVMSTAGQPVIVDVMISKNDRDTINTAAGGFDSVTGLPTNPVNVTINNDSGAQNIPALAAGDTIPSYSSRGPRLPDSEIKPDIAAPAEVVGVAQPFTGSGVENFNGTSSATPHVAGFMALLRQLHPSWSVTELNALACNTATHDLFTDTTHTTQYGVGRIGAGRIDLTNAANANVVALNGNPGNSGAVPSLNGVSFGVVETPVNSTSSPTMYITLENRGTTDVTYNLTIQNDPALTGTSFSFPNGSPVTVKAGNSKNIPVLFTATGSALRHARETSVASTQLGLSRQWLTEAAGYALFTPTDGSPTLRVALYAAPKPVSAIHSTITNFKAGGSNTGSFTINLSGSAVNTGLSLGNGFDILSLVKPFELQFVAKTFNSTDRNKIKYVGVTSDYPNLGDKRLTRVVFGIDRFGDAAEPDFAGSDTEIFFDTDMNGFFDSAIFLTTTGGTNTYVPEIVFFDNTAAMNVVGASLLTSVRTDNLDASVADTNAFNNSGVVIPLKALNHLHLIGGTGTGPTKFNYLVATFDRMGNLVDQTPLLTYDLAKPGLEVENSGSVAGVTKTPSGGAFTEPFFYNDLSTNSIPVNFNVTNFQNNGSLGVLLLHMHNGDKARSDVVTFTTK